MGGEKLPDDWTESAIVKIVKKEALSNLSVSSKILAKLIIRQISEAVDQRLRQEQVSIENDEDARTRSSLCATSSNSALNGRGSCTSTTRILRRLSIASTEKVYGAYSGHMEFHNRSSLSSRVSTTTSSAETETANPPSM